MERYAKLDDDHTVFTLLLQVKFQPMGNIYFDLSTVATPSVGYDLYERLKRTHQEATGQVRRQYIDAIIDRSHFLLEKKKQIT